MSNTNRKSLSSVNPLVETRNVIAMKEKTGNLYESIAVISRRANQISVTMKEELHRKLEEFTVHGDNLEEVHENKEQIEISRIYERMANAPLQAINEFNDDQIYYRKK
ncbi:MAG: DNA-directed polymerase subunit omega [Flavipsychrobacter sp.]|jgi:DNA-directed RNA polymerase subunit K/omega|nr:DNA-directed polymerase subunit omega [Flavipsychrobacter sp.]